MFFTLLSNCAPAHFYMVYIRVFYCCNTGEKNCLHVKNWVLVQYHMRRKTDSLNGHNCVANTFFFFIHLQAVTIKGFYVILVWDTYSISHFFFPLLFLVSCSELNCHDHCIKMTLSQGQVRVVACFVFFL